MVPDYEIEAGLPGPVIGIDEAGRGPWAGPVVAAAVWLDPGAIPKGLNDSKKLSAARREAALAALEGSAEIGIGIASVAEIEAERIVAATDLAMTRAVAALGLRASFALVDGTRLPAGLNLPGRAVIRGDGRSLSIAAASIAAKVTRDRIMDKLAADCPGYGWETNRGYGTPAHLEGLRRLGVTPHHRRGFRPIHNILYQESLTTR